MHITRKTRFVKFLSFGGNRINYSWMVFQNDNCDWTWKDWIWETKVRFFPVSLTLCHLSSSNQRSAKVATPGSCKIFLFVKIESLHEISEIFKWKNSKSQRSRLFLFLWKPLLENTYVQTHFKFYFEIFLFYYRTEIRCSDFRTCYQKISIESKN